MINWDEVQVGETEIMNANGHKRDVLIIHGVMVGTRECGAGYYHWDCVDDLDDWTIANPWEEITEQCTWEPADGYRSSWTIRYHGKVVYRGSAEYKTDGRRVWKRKEG